MQEVLKWATSSDKKFRCRCSDKDPEKNSFSNHLSERINLYFVTEVSVLVGVSGGLFFFRYPKGKFTAHTTRSFLIVFTWTEVKVRLISLSQVYSGTSSISVICSWIRARERGVCHFPKTWDLHKQSCWENVHALLMQMCRWEVVY